MTTQEFSSEFDLLYNNISSNQSPGLTEYEKGVFLTKAQDEIIKNYFTNVQGGNKYQHGIEDSEKRYADFSALLSVATLDPLTNATSFDQRGITFKLPDGTNGFPKTMIVITETFRTAKEENATTLTSYQVVPLKFEEYMRLMSKPSSDPLKKQVWKIMGNNTTGNGSIEIVPHWKDKDNKTNKLILKYIRKPYPIILEDLTPQGLSIEGCQVPYSGGDNEPAYEVKIIKASTGENEDGVYVIFDTNNNILLPGAYTTAARATSALSNQRPSQHACELAEELHPEILQRAVELAKIFYTGDNQQVMTAGTRSE